MIVRRDYKVPGGKLLRVELEVESDRVVKAVVRGDFFAYPEDAFEEAEAALAGQSVDSLCDVALTVFGKSPLRIFGASPLDISRALEETVREAQAH